MKALRTKVILSGIVLVFAFIATIGTTFAWFTISETVAVDGINLQVTSSDNLLIRVDDGGGTDDFTTNTFGSAAVTTVNNYQSSLTLADIEGVTKYGDIGTWRLSPVTAIQEGYTEVDAKTLNSLDDTYDTRTLSLANLYNSASGGYIELHFWLYSQASGDRTIEVQSTSITTTETDAQLQDIVDAVRFGIWLDDNDGAPGEAYIYGNDSDFGFEFLSGQAGYDDGYLFNKLSDSTSPLGGTDVYIEYVDDGDPGTDSTFDPMIDDGTNLLLETVTGSERVLVLSGGTNSTDIFTINPGTPTLVTVRIFIEGWDAEATNAIVNANFDLALGFTFGNPDGV